MTAAGRERAVLHLAHEIEGWRTRQPFSQPALYPLPHVLNMLLLCDMIQIHLFRPYYRSSLEVDPSAKDRCDQAAASGIDLLLVGLSFYRETLINVAGVRT